MNILITSLLVLSYAYPRLQELLTWTDDTLTYTPRASATTTPACPTITSTTAVCSTCIRPMCMAISTITVASGLNCPAAVPTSFTALGCDVDCPGGCAGTEWVVETAGVAAQTCEGCEYFFLVDLTGGW